MRLPWLTTVAAALALGAVMPAGAADGRPEKPSLRIAVGGRSALFYLPLTVTERLGYFSDAGLDVEIVDLSSGARTLLAVVSGTADVGTGTFDHAIQMQAKQQPVVAVVETGRYPGLVMGVIVAKASRFREPRDLKGMVIGVTGLGSSTHFMAGHIMISHGLNPDTDASFVAIGTTATAVAAARRGELDAIVTSDPMASLMTHEKLITVVADTRTADGTAAVYGGPCPGGVVYATPAFIRDHPATTQAVVDAFVRGLRWIAGHSPEEIAALMPPDYDMGNRAIYVDAIAASKPMYSPDGRILPGAAETAYAVLKEFNPAVASARIDLTKTYTDAFVARPPAGP